MGIIAMLLYSTHLERADLPKSPFWIMLVCYTAMGLGTLIGGWRIVKTMGSRITKLDPFGGFCAESGAAVTLFATAAAGIPVSTTHTIAGSIVGFGTMRRLSAVRWGVTVEIVWAWVLTIPAAGIIGAPELPRRIRHCQGALSRVGQAKRSPTNAREIAWWDCASLVPPYFATSLATLHYAKA